MDVKKGRKMCVGCLSSLIGELATLQVRKEHLVLAEVQRLCPAVDLYFVKWDCPILGGCSLHRPDMLWELPMFWLFIEVDEDGDCHEDDSVRL